MGTETYDTAVVGGGPAGSNAARVAKKLNPDQDVVLFEMGHQPASNCAGGLGIPFMNRMGLEPPEGIVMSPIRRVAIRSPNSETIFDVADVDLDAVDWVPEGTDCIGWVLDRQDWDNWQLQQAKNEGVDIRMKHTVKSIEQNGSVEMVVKHRGDNEDVKVRADHVGLANGPSWELAIDAGFDEDEVVPTENDMHMGFQYHMQDPEYFEQYGHDTISLILDRDYAPGGYTWCFPEGKEYTRWGNAIPLSMEHNATDKLDEFLKSNDKYENVETARQRTNAMIPTARPLKTAVKRNVALIGDSGHHCDPFHGGGMMFGSRAGKAFGEAIAKDDLQLYDQIWQDDFLDTLQNRFVLKDLVYSMDNGEYDRFVDAVTGFDVTGVNPDVQIPRMMWHILKSDPGIFTKSAADATRGFMKHKIGI
jgi:digeranylgeranylglycerophospholipid reductase